MYLFQAAAQRHGLGVRLSKPRIGNSSSRVVQSESLPYGYLPPRIGQSFGVLHLRNSKLPIRCRMHMLRSKICYVEHSGNILHCPWSTIQSLQFSESFMGRQGSGDDTFFMILRLRSLRHGGTCLYESKVVQKRLRMPGIWLNRSSNLAQRDVPLADVSFSLVRLLNKDVGIVLICSFSSSSFSGVLRCTTSLLLNIRFTQHVLKKYSG